MRSLRASAVAFLSAAAGKVAANCSRQGLPPAVGHAISSRKQLFGAVRLSHTGYVISHLSAPGLAFGHCAVQGKGCCSSRPDAAGHQSTRVSSPNTSQAQAHSLATSNSVNPGKKSRRMANSKWVLLDSYACNMHLPNYYSMCAWLSHHEQAQAASVDVLSTLNTF